MIKFDFNLLWTIINLIIFYVLMRVFLFKPIKKTIDKRNELIQNQFRQAEDANTAAEEKMADYESKIANAESEAQQIIDDAKMNAKTEYNKIIEHAQNDADELKEQNRKQLAVETENARRAAKEEIASLAMQAAEKVVGASVSDQTNSDIFDEFLNESSVE
ncbi:MAG: F0F1 ATP synthase subunit B [Clostridiales bacterium]|nr:F0F1 ATP synthase subunit B [Clostridiales bacterium]